MSFRPIKKATADVSVIVRVIDSTDGTPETSVAYDTAGVDLWYRRDGGLEVSITEVTQTVNGAHSDGGFVHISDGYCRLDLPDAACAAGVDGVMVGGVFTGMIVIGCYVPLVDYDPYDTVRLGLTALPNAASDAAGGLPISDAGALDLDALNEAAVRLTAARAGALTDWVNDGRLDLLLDAIPTTAMRGTDSAALASAMTTAQNDLDALTGADGATLATSQPNYAPNVVIPDAAGVAATPAEVATALTNIHLDHLLAANYDPASKPGVATALFNELIENDAGVSRYTANALEQAPTGGSAPTVGEIADQVWDEAQSGHVGAGTFGAIATEIAAIPTTAMRGTDSAATEAKQDIIDTNVDQLETAIITNAAGTDVAADIIALKAVADAIPTTAMRGTDSAALASVCTEGRLAELAAANLPADIAAIPTTAMRGTDNAALASVATETRLAELDAANLPTDIAAIPTTAMRGTDNAATEAKQDIIDTVVDAIKAKTDNLPDGIAKNAALSNFPVVMVLAADHVTPATGKTVTGQRSIDGAAFASVTGAIAEVSNGLYQFDAAAADTNGDIVVWRFSNADCDDTWIHIKTEA